VIEPLSLDEAYLETEVVTLCLFGRTDNNSDLELIVLYFQDETKRRNLAAV
jgi:nucleotidyltransferase/DNA polymerase involved in DNA repair